MKLTPQLLVMYLGCRVQVRGDIGILMGFRDGEAIKEAHDTLISLGKTEFNNFWFALKEVKLILRRLEDMTEEEKRERDKLIEEVTEGDYYFVRTSAVSTAYKLSKSFDLFNLIPDGLAIDAATIKKTEA